MRIFSIGVIEHRCKDDEEKMIACAYMDFMDWHRMWNMLCRCIGRGWLWLTDCVVNKDIFLHIDHCCVVILILLMPSSLQNEQHSGINYAPILAQKQIDYIHNVCTALI